MGWIIVMTILAILIGLAALIWAGYRNAPAGSDGKLASKVCGWIAVVLVGMMGIDTFACSFTTVSTKNVGIETAFGATSGHLSNGAHMIPPWDNVTEMDAAIQTDSYTDKKGDNGECLSVRIGNQQTACVSVSIRWRINPDQADSLYQNFRTFEHVRDSLVTPELTAAVNEQFANYNPLNSVATTNPGDKRNPPLNVIANRVTAQMKHEIGQDGIEVLNTIIPLVTFDPQTQNRINQLQQQFALTRIAEQEQITNHAQAIANKKLATSVNNSPNVLVAQCLQILGEMVKQGQAVPAGFSCWPGSKTPVIANATTATK